MLMGTHCFFPHCFPTPGIVLTSGFPGSSVNIVRGIRSSLFQIRAESRTTRARATHRLRGMQRFALEGNRIGWSKGERKKGKKCGEGGTTKGTSEGRSTGDIGESETKVENNGRTRGTRVNEIARVANTPPDRETRTWTRRVAPRV